jgi:hypothetical protein
VAAGPKAFLRHRLRRDKILDFQGWEKELSLRFMDRFLVFLVFACFEISGLAATEKMNTQVQE